MNRRDALKVLAALPLVAAGADCASPPNYPIAEELPPITATKSAGDSQIDIEWFGVRIKVRPTNDKLNFFVGFAEEDTPIEEMENKFTRIA